MLLGLLLKLQYRKPSLKERVLAHPLLVRVNEAGRFVLNAVVLQRPINVDDDVLIDLQIFLI